MNVTSTKFLAGAGQGGLSPVRFLFGGWHRLWVSGDIVRH